MPGLQLTRTLRHKVPEIVVLFWVVKLLSTAMGEAFSDLTISRIDVPADQRAVESGGAESSRGLARRLKALHATCFDPCGHIAAI